jgi:ribosome maturation factor RimP
VVVVAGIGAQLTQLIERTVEGLGYEFVDFERAGGGLLRVTLDAPEAQGGVGLDDCEKVSRQLTRVFEVEGVDYDRLEVSSPGLDRRLSKPRDFARFAGQQVQVQLAEPVEGRRRFKGRLVGVSGAEGAERVRLELMSDDAQTAGARGRQPRRGKAGKAAKEAPAAPAQVIEVALAAIDRARLVPELQFGSKR